MAQEGKILIWVALVVVGATIVDLIRPRDEDAQQQTTSVEKSIPKLKMDLSGSPEIPQITFLYW